MDLKAYYDRDAHAKHRMHDLVVTYNIFFTAKKIKFCSIFLGETITASYC
jgi:hypothetical protein